MILNHSEGFDQLFFHSLVKKDTIKTVLTMSYFKYFVADSWPFVSGNDFIKDMECIIIGKQHAQQLNNSSS